MHDPLVVAFEIPLPIPRRVRWREQGPRRWGVDGAPGYAWWRPHRYSLRLAGRAYGLRYGVTVWHREPDGRDSGEVCPHYSRVRRDSKWETRVLHGWRFHVHHWHLQVHALQALRRWALTRCAWCGGPSRKGSPVNVSHSWDGPRSRWWQGAPGLFHVDCSAAEHSARSCVCDDPVTEHDGWGRCARCARFYDYGRTLQQTEVLRLLQQVPSRTRPSESVMVQVQALRDRAEQEATRDGR